MQRRQEAKNRSQVSLDGQESSFMPSISVAEKEALPLRNQSDVRVPVHERLITTSIRHVQESASSHVAFLSSPEVVTPVTRIANADPVPFPPYTSEIPELEYCARSTPFSTSSGCYIPTVKSTCADIGDLYAAPTSLAGQETHARSLPLTAPFYFDTHPLRRSDFATDQFRHHPTAKPDRESYAPFRDAQFSLPDLSTHQASQARSSTCIRHTPDSASSPELGTRMTRIANADPVPFQPNTFAGTGLEYYAPSASFSTSSGCDILRARNSSADFGASNAFPISLTGQETHVRPLPLSSLSNFDTHPLRRSYVGTDPFRHNPSVADVSPVPLTVAEGRLCTSYGTQYRAPVMGEEDVSVGSVQHNPELGSHIFSPTVQPIERWQDTHTNSSAPQGNCQGNSTPSSSISGSKPLPLGTAGSVKTVSEDHRTHFDECTMLNVHAHSTMHRSLPENKPQNSRNEIAFTTLSPGQDTHARPLFPPSSSNIDTDWSRNLYITTNQLHHIPTAQRGRESHASLATISTLSQYITHGTGNASTASDPFQPFRNKTLGMEYYARSAATANSSDCNTPTAAKTGVDSVPSSTLPTRSTLPSALETLDRPLSPLPNSIVKDEDMASSKQPDSKDSQLAPEFEPAYIPQFGLKSYRSSNVPVSLTSIQESTTSATSMNLKTRRKIDASSESSLMSSDMEIVESNACQKIVQRSHNPTDNNTGNGTGEQRYICKTCNKSFNRQDYLVSHNRTHTGERPYSCTTCNKAFSRRSTLANHIRTHTDERPYSCTDCNKAFNQKTHLTRHIRTHTGERPYKCDQCEMAFIRARDRARHIKGKHPGQ